MLAFEAFEVVFKYVDLVLFHSIVLLNKLFLFLLGLCTKMLQNLRCQKFKVGQEKVKSRLIL